MCDTYASFMTKRTIIFLLLGILVMAFWSKWGETHNATDEAHEKAKNIYEFTLNTIDGKPRALSAYKGKVLLIVNTASKCGYTPQYKTLESLYEHYKDRGLSILAFPANNFGWQEPGTNEQIKEFCSKNYHVTFDLFEKISVKGSDKHPLYTYLTEDSPFPGEVKWNFQKYLVDRQGNVVARFSHKTDPMSSEVVAKVEEVLAENFN